MLNKIDNKNYQLLIKGASIFTTGGGVPVTDQLQSLNKLGRINSKLSSLEEFPKDGYLCTAAELGPTDVPPLEKAGVIKKMLKLLKQVTGKNIVGLYPPEIGQENIILESSTYLKLPIADFDPVGQRAVPFIDINIFNLKSMKGNYTPMVVSTDRGEIFLLEGNVYYERLEEILRGMTVFSKSGVVFLLGGVLSVKDLLRNKITQGSYSQALRLGSIRDIDKLKEILHPKLSIKARVVKKKELKVKGFLAEIVTIKDTLDNTYQLVILNEVIFLLDGKGKVLYSVPDRILIIDPNKIVGASGATMSIGMELEVFVINPLPEWKTEKANKIFGRERFEFLLKEAN